MRTGSTEEPGANHGVFLAASLTNHMCMPSGRCKSVLGRARVCVSVIAPKSLTSLILVAWPLAAPSSSPRVHTLHH